VPTAVAAGELALLPVPAIQLFFRCWQSSFSSGADDLAGTLLLHPTSRLILDYSFSWLREELFGNDDSIHPAVFLLFPLLSWMHL
jgi:hypothetical protein